MLISLSQESNDPVAVKLVERHREASDSYFRRIFYLEPEPSLEYIRFLAGWITLSMVSLVPSELDMLARLVGLGPNAPFGLDLLEAYYPVDVYRGLSRRFLMNGAGPYHVDLPAHCLYLVFRCMAIIDVHGTETDDRSPDDLLYNLAASSWPVFLSRSLPSLELLHQLWELTGKGFVLGNLWCSSCSSRMVVDWLWVSSLACSINL